ncbi:MAG TPA: tetratricopeptide repeat protein [Rhizomicrobium sp.]|nr:tetratricopeptide repeat protein [Rhizomicrobium sp.]
MAQKPNPHDRLFRAADRAKGAFDRRKGAQLRQNARNAQQAKNWALAESLWRQALEGEPDDRASVVGLAQVLVYNAKLDEARALAERIVAAWPADENGPTVLARLAEELGDADAAVRQWRRVLEIAPTRSQALIRLGRLMIARGDFDAARECADKLAMVAPDNPAAVQVRAEMASAQGDTAEAVRQRRLLTEKFPHQMPFWRDYGAALIEAGQFDACEGLIAKLRAGDPQNGLRLEGQLLAARAPELGHSEFWEKAHAAFPDNVDFLRKHLHAALRDGKREAARALLDTLFGSALLKPGDVNYVIGLINLEGTDPRPLIRTFLKRFRGTSDYRRLALRLSRAIFQAFAKSPANSARNTQRMLRHMPGDDGARAFLDRACRVLDGTLADTDIRRDQCERFVAVVREKLATKTPWSFVRLGDGESNALTYAPDIARHFERDAGEREMVWWGRTLTAADRGALAARVAAAIQGADALGVPTLERLVRDVRPERREFLSGRAGRGLATVMDAVESGTLKPFTSAHIQHDLEKWNLYPALFDGADVLAVSCHAKLPFETIVVPPRHASLASFGMREMGPKILPEVLDDIVARLPGDLSGRLVIVGAGYAGKAIVAEAKARGAVALDLGSILDYWIGAATRSYLSAGRAAS